MCFKIIKIVALIKIWLCWFQNLCKIYWFYIFSLSIKREF